MNVHSHYENLKVSRDAPPEVIRAAYKALCMLWHPDRSADPRAPEIMKTINIAYETLSDPVTRAQHDQWLAAEELKWTFAHQEVKAPSQRAKQPEPGPQPVVRRGRAFEIDEAMFASACEAIPKPVQLRMHAVAATAAVFGLAGIIGAVQVIFHGSPAG